MLIAPPPPGCPARGTAVPVTGELPLRRPELLLLLPGSLENPPLEPPELPEADEVPPEDDPPDEDPPPPEGVAVPADVAPPDGVCCPLAGRGTAIATMPIRAAAKSERFMPSSGERPTNARQQLNCQRPRQKPIGIQHGRATIVIEVLHNVPIS